LKLERTGISNFSIISNPNLVYVNLSHNGLTIFPPGFLDCPNLETLNLSYNHIEEIPVKINKLKSLYDLALEYNEIHTVPVQISELTNVSTSSFSWGPQTILDGNPICTIPPEVEEWLGYWQPNCPEEVSGIVSENRKNSHLLIKNGVIHLNNYNNKIVSVDLFDASGKKIKQLFKHPVSGETLIPLGNHLHSAGIYFIRTNIGNQIAYHTYIHKR
jgi:Leucine-rich repeat (LRR) protein